MSINKETLKRTWLYIHCRKLFLWPIDFYRWYPKHLKWLLMAFQKNCMIDPCSRTRAKIWKLCGVDTTGKFNVGYDVYFDAQNAKHLIKVIALILAGYIFMVFIGLIRSGDTGGDLGQDSLFLTFVYDFVSANGANSFLIDYTDKYGITGGSNMILQTLSIIPFFQSIILSFVSKDNFAPNSSKFFTESFMDSTQGGLGTALIGDIYYSFGIVGVIILMFLIGLLVNKLSRAHNSPYAIALLIMFSGNALFAPRVEYCYILRSLSYTIIFLYIILSVSHNRSASNECSLRN